MGSPSWASDLWSNFLRQNVKWPAIRSKLNINILLLVSSQDWRKFNVKVKIEPLTSTFNIDMINCKNLSPADCKTNGLSLKIIKFHQRLRMLLGVAWSFKTWVYFVCEELLTTDLNLDKFWLNLYLKFL